VVYYFHIATLGGYFSERYSSSGQSGEHASTGTYTRDVTRNAGLEDEYVETITTGFQSSSIENCAADQYSIVFNLSSDPMAPIAMSNGNHVGYSQVQVYSVSEEGYAAAFNRVLPDRYYPRNMYVTDAAKENGYASFSYINEKPAINPLVVRNEYDVSYRERGTSFPFGPVEEIAYQNGKLLIQRSYANGDGSFDLQSETINEYRDQIIDVPVEALVVRRKVLRNCYSCSFEERHSFLGIRPYSNKTRWHLLERSVSKQYENDSIVSEVNYFYDEEAPYAHFMSTGSSSIDSEGDVTEVDIIRDLDFPSLVTEQETFVNGVQVGGEQIDYSGFQPAKFSVWNRDFNEYTDELVYYYGADNEPRAITSSQNAEKAFVWGYGGSRLIAELTNVSRTELDQIMSRSDIRKHNWFRDDSNRNTYKEELLAIKARLNDNEFMKIYLYETPYGPSQVIDENGYEMNYSYDVFGRLSTVKDKDNSVLESFKYQYINQNLSNQ